MPWAECRGAAPDGRVDARIETRVVYLTGDDRDEHFIPALGGDDSMTADDGQTW